MANTEASLEGLAPKARAGGSFTGSWLPVFGVVITLDLLAAVLAVAVLKPLRRKLRYL